MSVSIPEMYNTLVTVYAVLARDSYPEETLETDYKTCRKKCRS